MNLINKNSKSPLLAFIKFEPTFLTDSLAVCASFSEATISSFSLATKLTSFSPNLQVGFCNSAIYR